MSLTTRTYIDALIDDLNRRFEWSGERLPLRSQRWLVSAHSTKLDRRLPLRVLWIAACCSSAILVVFVGAGCSQSKPYMAPDLDDRADAGALSSSPDEQPDFPTTGIDADKLTLTGIEPASGPFSGGTPSVLRGSGFG